MLSTCIQCGVCSSSCSMRYNMNLRRVLARFLNGENFWSEELWNCTNCLICQERCPRGIKLVEKINEARALQLEKGYIPVELKKMLENIQKFSNPFGPLKKPKFDAKVAKRGEFEFLLFLGCSVYDPRIQSVANKAIELLKLANVDFAVLETEFCCGNDVRAIGESGLFEDLKEKNMEKFRSLGVDKVITISPHCYNAFRNYYGLNVHHISQILLDKIKKAELKFKKVFEARVTYHDPCYLSRHNRIISEPRELINSIPGIEVVEMQRNGELSLCCGGGSGGIVRNFPWKPSLERIREASLTGAEYLITSCPFCLIMLEDASKVKKTEIKVMDIVEVLHSVVF